MQLSQFYIKQIPLVKGKETKQSVFVSDRVTHEDLGGGPSHCCLVAIGRLQVRAFERTNRFCMRLYKQLITFTLNVIILGNINPKQRRSSRFTMRK